MKRVPADQGDTARTIDAIRRIVQTLRVASRDAELRFGMRLDDHHRPHPGVRRRRRRELVPSIDRTFEAL
jgi:hypothetical protein